MGLMWYTIVFRCGYATIHDVTKKDCEDRMESFFLSETCKYLYLVSIYVFTLFLWIVLRCCSAYTSSI